MNYLLIVLGLVAITIIVYIVYKYYRGMSSNDIPEGKYGDPISYIDKDGKKNYLIEAYVSEQHVKLIYNPNPEDHPGSPAHFLLWIGTIGTTRRIEGGLEWNSYRDTLAIKEDRKNLDSTNPENRYENLWDIKEIPFCYERKNDTLNFTLPINGKSHRFDLPYVGDQLSA